MKHRLTRAVLALVATAAMTAGTLATAQARPSSTDEPGPVDIPQRYLEQEIDWSTCSFDATVKQLYPDAPTTRCAEITVPMDWNDPDAHPDITLAIAHSEATGESQGLMTTNPGGPGGAGLTMSAALAITKTQLFSDYELLGFDPRGFGQSTNVQCLIDVDELNEIPVVADYRERNAETHEVEIAEAKAYAKACSSTEFSEFVNTQQTVYDMDFLRALLEHDTLNYIGYSYGTWLGTWYADTYPDHVGRFVLDSNMNWVDDMFANEEADSASFQRRRDAMLFPWIARHDAEIGLGSTAKQVEQRYEKIRAKLVANTKEGINTPYGYELDVAVLQAIYTNDGFLDAAEAMLALEEIAFAEDDGAADAERKLAAIRGDVAMTPSEAIAQARREAASSGDEVVDLGAMGTVVRCNDTPYSDNIQRYLNQADKHTRDYSFIGYFNTVPVCAYWPFEQQPRRVDLRESPTLLMIQSEGDPATSAEGALRSHQLTRRNTVMVMVPDEGQHGIYIGGPSQCVEDLTDGFVFDGEVPKDMSLCATSPLIGDDEVHPLVGPFDRYERLAASKQQPADPNPMLRQLRRHSVGLR
ncbi:MAG TPA: alpha/beta fold hydrolase [Candidatus Avipropionibacterium avicola]|uniref:Alpha/beta fold hydrolase n=1 Tax=Candidatus Avipropionibacterium avicola TaxID=2840701 RepID=A0A9D1H088_9ACTN|nr:alpha/beta fold hydrolase [Candidatus Avipropionibacterium avicola]